jgi:hypothetical protein
VPEIVESAIKRTDCHRAARTLIDIRLVKVLNVDAAVGGPTQVSELDVNLRVAEKIYD